MLAVEALIAFFVGFGIQAFYPAPELLQNPTTTGLLKGPPAEELSPELEAEEQEFARQMRTYQEELPAYKHTSSLVAVGVSVLILAAVLLLRGLKIRAIRDGVGPRRSSRPVLRPTAVTVSIDPGVRL